MAYSTLPISGVDLNDTQTVAEIAANGGVVTFGPLGTETFASDGKRYVWAKANATITASTTTCTASPTTFLVTATGGAYTSPAVAMAAGDYGWFAAASV
jgi:hypothetical protein